MKNPQWEAARRREAFLTRGVIREFMPVFDRARKATTRMPSQLPLRRVESIHPPSNPDAFLFLPGYSLLGGDDLV